MEGRDHLCSYTYEIQLPGELVAQKKTCDRPVIKDKFCLFHVRIDEKNHETLFQEVQAQFERGDYADFHGFYFPRGFRFSLPSKVKAPLIIDKAEFADNLNIEGVVCESHFLARYIITSHIILRNSRFMSSVDFSGAKAERMFSVANKSRFDGSLIANGLTTREIQWSGLVVRGDTTLKHAEFSERIVINNGLFGGKVILHDVNDRKGLGTQPQAVFFHCRFNDDFDLTRGRFIGGVSFSKVRFAPSKNVMLDGCNISGGRISFDRCRFMSLTSFFKTQIGGVENSSFFDSCDMSNVLLSHLPAKSVLVTNPNFLEDKATLDHEGHLVLKDEFLLKAKSDRIKYHITARHVIAHYRKLEKHFFDKSMFTLAARCNNSIMRCRRFDPHYGHMARFFNACYDYLFEYGYSILRPLGWIAAFVFGLPLLFDLGKAGIWDDSITGWGAGIVENLYFLSLSRHVILASDASAWAKLILLIESLLVYLSVGFLIVAIRRRFTPKKPIDG
jgi:hypothetical protein